MHLTIVLEKKYFPTLYNIKLNKICYLSIWVLICNVCVVSCCWGRKPPRNWRRNKNAKQLNVDASLKNVAAKPRSWTKLMKVRPFPSLFPVLGLLLRPLFMALRCRRLRRTCIICHRITINTYTHTSIYSGEDSFIPHFF